MKQQDTAEPNFTFSKAYREQLLTAYRNGADAKLNNQSEDRNPYTVGSPMWHEWQRGYGEARI